MADSFRNSGNTSDKRGVVDRWVKKNHFSPENMPNP